jgi:hypothetical protein
VTRHNAVNRLRLITAEAQFRSQGSPCWTFGGQSGSGTGSFSRPSDFPTIITATVLTFTRVSGVEQWPATSHTPP